MSASLRLVTRPGRCLCGLRVQHHFTIDNCKVSCEVARQQHPRARGVSSLRSSLLASVYVTGLRMTHGNVIGMIGVK